MSVAAAELLAGTGAAEEAAASADGFFGRVGQFFGGARDHLSADHLPIPYPKAAPVGTAASVAAATVNPHAI